MIKGAKLTYRLSKICNSCQQPYLARQASAKICDSCRNYQNERIPCKCGCGKLCIRKKSGYAAGCKYRGKSYNERFVNRNPNTGFKKGVLNPNYTRSKFIGLKMSNSKGEKFRSSLEVQFSELCIEHNIQYEYEKKIFLKDGRLKIVDFVIENLIHVEITGFAYLKWRQSFIEKMRVLRETIDNPILILTYKKNLKEDLHNTSIKTLSDTDVLLEDIDNSEGIVKKIKLFQNSFLLNQIIKK